MSHCAHKKRLEKRILDGLLLISIPDARVRAQLLNIQMTLKNTSPPGRQRVEETL